MVGVTLAADVAVPEPARGVVLLAHGNGSPRNRRVAAELQTSILADLLTLRAPSRRSPGSPNAGPN